MFERVLIANRGEIAVRIIRACREMGIQSVAVYSQADETALHVQMADEAICIGPPASSDSYLKIANLISAAEVADVDAIHPGYGFLSENAHFAEICAQCNIAFIGPSADNIRRMGDKAVARETMKKAGVPVTPGSDGIIKTPEDAVECAKRIGYPVLVKAVAGGGGKGMRIARNDVSLAQGLMTARAEAERAFGNPDVYLEKYIEQSRHIEFQIIGDQHGNIVHLGERDCSIQRRHQKLLEESPSPAMNPDLRRKIGRAAVRAATSVGYQNAGTVEFLFDVAEKRYYFMEMNTRIQVEHPITEEVTGIDLIKAQLLSAAGEKLPFTQKDIQFRGHAIEFRINAENPFRGFSPSPGRIELAVFPGGRGVRVDSHIYTGFEISPYYDSMLAKLIVHGESRDDAVRILSRALHECAIHGVHSTIPAGQAIVADAQFRRGDYTTAYLDHLMQDTFSIKP